VDRFPSRARSIAFALHLRLDTTCTLHSACSAPVAFTDTDKARVRRSTRLSTLGFSLTQVPGARTCTTEAE
jgi:hypothetical protein